MDWSWEHLMAFAQEKWWLILIAVIVVAIIVKVVKTIIKWALIAIIVIGLFVYGMNYEPIKDAINQIAEHSLDVAFELMAGEAQEATYTINDDGTFTVESSSIRISGAADSDKVTIYLRGVRLGEVSITSAIESYIEMAREGSQ